MQSGSQPVRRPRPQLEGPRMSWDVHAEIRLQDTASGEGCGLEAQTDSILDSRTRGWGTHVAELGPCLACSVMGCRHGQAFVPSSVELWGVKGEAMGTPCLLRPCLHHVTPSVTYKGHPPPPSKVPPLPSPLHLASASILAPRSPSHAPQGS